MRMLVAGMLAGLVLAMGSGSARALCAGHSSPSRSLADGGIAFVGAVGLLRNSDRWATFQVDEVWSSHEIARFVEVRGGLGEESFLDIFSNVGSTDRYFERGVTYLVFPTTEDGILFDDECSATQEWSSDLLAFRPTTAHPPVSGSALPGGVPLPLLAAGLAVAVAIAAGATLLRRRRSSEV